MILLRGAKEKKVMRINAKIFPMFTHIGSITIESNYYLFKIVCMYSTINYY